MDHLADCGIRRIFPRVYRRSLCDGCAWWVDAWRRDRRRSGLGTAAMAEVPEEAGVGRHAGCKSGSQILRITQVVMVPQPWLTSQPAVDRHRIPDQLAPGQTLAHPKVSLV